MSTLINHPQSVFVYNDQVLFADYYNHRIRKILPNGSTVTIAGTGVEGYNGDDQLATMAQLKYPCCVFVSERGEVYIGEEYRVRKIQTNGMIITVADGYNDRIRKVLKNGIITTIAGTGVTRFNGDHILAIHAQLNDPSSVFVSKANEVFISDSGNHRIRKIYANGIISTIVGTGEGGYCGDGNLSVLSTINDPAGVMIVNDEIYIADRYNHRIRKVLKNGMITTIAGTVGGEGYNGDDLLAVRAQLSYPTSVFVSNSNEVFISERDSHRIRKIDSNGIISTVAGNGKCGYAGDIEYNHNEHGIIGRCELCGVKILKHESDCLYSSSVIGFLPMIELIAPQFTKNVLNENFISQLDSKEQKVVQQFIDSILYDPEKMIGYDTIEDILRILFILNHTCGEFINLKKNLATSFVEKLQVDNVFDVITTIEKYLVVDLNAEEYIILSKVKEFCFSYVLKSMQKSNCELFEDERLSKYYMFILRAMGTMPENNSLFLCEYPFNSYVKLGQ